MPRFLVEVSQPERVATKRIRDSVRMIGSHFATHADWRQEHGVSTGTMVLEAANRWAAFNVVPPNMRPDARIFQLEPVAATLSASARTGETTLHHLIAA